MNQNKCAFCSRSDVDLILLGSGRSCSSCLIIAHDLVNVVRFSPSNKVEEVVLSLIFFLETDLIFTRQTLKSLTLNDDVLNLVKQKREKLEKVVVNYKNVDAKYLKKIESLLGEHKSLLNLYDLT
ncbi:hypothetical protein AB4501_22310 [Vibrio sp. 10N.222.55.E8]|uniref:hypothetical protein n=1 Tax=Vibrio artabrorum TaxID=446374 RepID=UPI00354CBEEF